jgi:hypothetical protein
VRNPSAIALLETSKFLCYREKERASKYHSLNHCQQENRHKAGLSGSVLCISIIDADPRTLLFVQHYEQANILILSFSLCYCGPELQSKALALHKKFCPKFSIATLSLLRNLQSCYLNIRGYGIYAPTKILSKTSYSFVIHFRWRAADPTA